MGIFFEENQKKWYTEVAKCMTKTLLIRTIISYILLIVSFVIYLIFGNVFWALMIIFFGLLIMLSGLLVSMPRGLLREHLGIKNKSRYLPPVTHKKSMADIKSDVEKFNDIWQELDK